MKRYIYLALAAFIFISYTQASASDNGGDIFVSLTRKEEPSEKLPVNVTNISNAEISEKKPTTLADLLTDQTGVTFGRVGTIGGTVSLMLRGSTPEQVLVLLDGQRMNDISFGTIDLGTIPTENIDHIEIIRGGMSSMYGTGAFGGIINIITKKEADCAPGLGLSVSEGSFNTQSYSVNMQAKKKNVSAFFSANKTLSDGYRNDSDYDGKDLFAKFGFNSSGSGEFGLTASFNSNDFGFPGQATDANGNPLTTDEYNGTLEKAATFASRQRDTKSYWKADNTRSWESLTLKSSVYSSFKDSLYTDPFTDDDYRSSVFGGNSQLSNGAGTTAGAEWWEEIFKRTDNLANVTAIDKSRVDTALYIQQELYTGKFGLIPSVRYDENSVFGGVACPHVTVTYRPAEHIKLSANSGKVWRAPTFDDLFFNNVYFAGNPDLKPEEGIASDIGLEYKTMEWRTSVAVFLTETKNLLTSMPDSNGIYHAVNLGQTRQSGVEYEFSQKLASGLYQKFNYTYLDARDTLNDKPLVYRPHDSANYGLSFLTPACTRFDVSAQYVGEVQTGVTPSSLPEYALLNLGISQKFKDWEIWVKVDNVMNKLYQTRLGYPLPGVVYSTGLNVKFWD